MTCMRSKQNREPYQIRRDVPVKLTAAAAEEERWWRQELGFLEGREPLEGARGVKHHELRKGPEG